MGAYEDMMAGTEELSSAPEKGFIGKAWDDVTSTLGNFATGAKQGYREIIRQGDNLATSNPLALSGTPMGEGITNAPAPPQTDQQAQDLQQYQKATDTFLNETVKPVVGTAALAGALPVVGPVLGTTGTAAGIGYTPFLASDVINSYKKGGALEAARDLTYGPVVDFASQPDLKQQFFARPVSTASNGVMAALPLALMGRGLHESVIRLPKVNDQGIPINNKITDEFNNFRVESEAIKDIPAPTAKVEAPPTEVKASARGEDIIAAGETQLGKPYELGADGTNATDCGLFTQQTLAKNGIELNYRTADGQYLQLEQEGKTFTSEAQAQVGDLVFFDVPSNRKTWSASNDPSAVNSSGEAYKGVTHVGIYAGEGKVLQAGSKGVSYADINAFGDIVGFGKTGEGKAIAKPYKNEPLSKDAENQILADKSNADTVDQQLNDMSGKSKEALKNAEKELIEEPLINIANEIGLKDNTFYNESLNELKKHTDSILVARDKAENSLSFQKKLNDHLEEVRKLEESKLNETPLYSASNALSFDLQMFGNNIKNVKEVAEKYIGDRLTETQKYYIDNIAEQHGFSSGHELAKKIKNNKLKDEEIHVRLNHAAEEFKKQELGNKYEERSQISDAKIKATAIEANALKDLANGEHRKASKERIEQAYISKFKDAESRLLVEIQKAKGDAKAKELQKQLTELKKQHSEEIKQLNIESERNEKQYKEQLNGKNKEFKEQIKHDNNMAKEWLKAEETSQRLARTTMASVKEAKEYAKNELSKIPIKEAMDYKKFLNDAKVSAKQSEKSYRAGKYEEAALLKNAEMLNNAMAVEAFEISKVFDKQESYLNKVTSKNKDLFKTVENFNQVGSLLDRFGLKRKDYEPNTKTETLKQWSDRMDEVLGTVNLPEWVYDESIRKSYKELTMPELKDLTDSLKNIQKVANQEKTSIAVNKGRSLEEMKLEQLNEIENLKTIYNPKLEPTTFDRFKNSASNYLYQLQTFSTVISKLQGWKTFGKLEEFWIKPVHERANLESKRIAEFKTEIEKIWNEYTDKERKSMANNKIYYDEIETSLTKMNLISMALNIGNEGNRSKLFGSRPVGINKSKPWGEKTVMDLLSNNLTKKDWTTVQKTWDLLNSIWPDLSKFHTEMTGFEPKKVESTPFNVKLPNGDLIHIEGGYYPLKEDRRASLVAAERASAESELYTEKNPAWKATTNTGATKQRTNAQYSVDLNPSLMNKHIIDVVHDLYFRDIVSDYRRMLNNKDFQEAIRNKLGESGPKIFKDYIANIANGESYRDVGMTGIEQVVNYLRQAGTKAAITFRVGVITQNAANIVLYPKAIEGFNVSDAAIGMVRHGLLDYIPKVAFNWKAAKQLREDVYELSPYMRDRRMMPDYSLSDLKNNMFSKGDPVTEFGLSLLTASDDMIAVPMWKQAYEKKLSETGDLKQASYYADSLIKAVNGSGRKYDVSPLMRSKSATDKVFSSFYGFMNTEFNRWVKESGIAVQDIKNVPRFIGFAASRMIVFTIMSNLLAGKEPKDKENPISYWTGQIASYPLQLLPVIRDIAPVIINASLGLQTYGYNPPIALSELENISRATTKTMSYLNATGKTTKQDVAESYAKVAAYGTGYPDQFNAWFFNLYDYYTNNMKPETKDIMKRRPNEEQGHTRLINDLEKGNNYDAKQAKAQGDISENEYNRLIKYQKMSPIERKIDGVSVEKALKIYSEATIEEKNQIRSAVKKKVENAKNNLTPSEQQELKNKATILK